MKATIITTINHNVGDDFVREGIKYLFKEVLKDKIEFSEIHKHSPITARYGFEWFRYYRLSKYFDSILPINISSDRISEADIVIQSGAPVYWCHPSLSLHCPDNEWFKALIGKRFSESKQLLFNLAAGSCQKYHSDGSEFCERCKEYANNFAELSSLTTVRDNLSLKL